MTLALEHFGNIHVVFMWAQGVDLALVGDDVMPGMNINHFIDFLSDIYVFIYKVLQPVENVLNHGDCCTTTLNTILEIGDYANFWLVGN